MMPYIYIYIYVYVYFYISVYNEKWGCTNHVMKYFMDKYY